MEIRSESRISHPQERVYIAYRDELPAIAKYMPDIKEVVVKKRETIAAGVKLHNEWVSSRELPSVVSKIIRPEHMRWDDYAEWNDSGHYVDWNIRMRVFTDAVTCKGRNQFIAEGNHTRVIVAGNLDIDLREIPGVPRLVAGGLRPTVEKFIVGLITPNLEKVNASLQRYLDTNK